MVPGYLGSGTSVIWRTWGVGITMDNVSSLGLMMDAKVERMMGQFEGFNRVG